MINHNKIICPICRGKGEIVKPRIRHDLRDLREKAVVKLRESGFSFGEIMKLVGYKSPNSITKILKNR